MKTICEICGTACAERRSFAHQLCNQCASAWLESPEHEGSVTALTRFINRLRREALAEARWQRGGS